MGRTCAGSAAAAWGRRCAGRGAAVWPELAGRSAVARLDELAGGAPGGAGRPAPPIRFLREERERRQRYVPAFRFDVKGCRGRIGKISYFLFVMN